MGACTFTNYYVGKLKVQEAYNQLCENARIEYGQDPYNGTISTTSFIGYREQLPREDFLESINKDLEKMGKWKCKCIVLKGVSEKRLKASHPELKGKRGINVYVFYGWAST